MPRKKHAKQKTFKQIIDGMEVQHQVNGRMETTIFVKLGGWEQLAIARVMQETLPALVKKMMEMKKDKIN